MVKTLITTFLLSVITTLAFAQIESINIKVPDFADPEVKTFYQAYSDHLVKCIHAIRTKNEAKVTALFKDPGEKLVAKEKILAKEIVKTPIEKQKYIQFAEQAYPYIKEVEQSVYYRKLYSK